MKTLNTITLLCLLLCGSFYANAQILCGVNAAFQQNVNPNNVASFYSTSVLDSNWQINSYAWTFGDGSTSNLQNPTHLYTTPGTYTVCLTVSATLLGGVTCTDNVCHTVVIGAPGCGNTVANFTISQSGGGTVVLYSTSTGVSTGALYQWWVDGNVVTTPTSNTSFTVTNLPPGNHNFCLYVFNNNINSFCDSACRTESVAGPNCTITATIRDTININGAHILSVIATGSAPFTYNWNTGAAATADIVVTASGNYCVTVTDVNGCSATACSTIASNPCSGLSAQFTQTYVSGGAVAFIPVNNTVNVTHRWFFGDGNDSNLPNPTHCYTTAGVYMVYHIVNIPGTICADTSFHQVQTTACNPCTGFSVQLGWGPNPALGGFNIEANITNNISSPVTYLWSNGDTGRVIRVTQTGIYCVTATSGNCTATACDTVGIGNNCNLFVSITSPSNNPPYILQATAIGGTPPYTYAWSNAQVGNPITVTVLGVYCVTIIDANGCSAAACYTSTPPTGTDTICGVAFEDLNGNGVMDSTEQGIPGAVIQISGMTVLADSFGYYQVIVNTGTYNVIYCAPLGYSYTLPISPNATLNNCGGYFQVHVTGGGTHCGYNFGVQNNSVSICGNVYLDGNNNQQRDSTEQGVANVRVYLTSSTGQIFNAYTNAQGNYCVLVPAGTYVVRATSNTFSSCPITPLTINVTATTPGMVYNNNNFGVYCQPGLCNLNVNITPHTTVTAGFAAWYSIQVCNIGSSVSGGTVNLFYDTELTFDRANPVQSSHNASTRTVTWNVSNLMPGNCRYYWVYFNANLGIQLEAPVFTLVNITPDANCNDVNMNNNVDTVHQAVTGSWDPNNKLAYVTNHEENPAFQWISSIVADQRMEYVINFQNLGTGPAVNVVIKDELSADFDISSFEFLGASHPCVVTSVGSNFNFKFSNIMLPAEMYDEPNSHGWVKFAIRAVDGLPGGHVISDFADIYFDFNDAVTTNDAEVIMLDATGINDQLNIATAVIAPNPMSRFTEVRLQNSQADSFTFKVIDLTGRTVSEKISSGNVLLFERDLLSGGLYMYQVIQNNKPVAKGKLVIE